MTTGIFERLLLGGFPSNRWRGTKLLRERWKAHIDQSLWRPVLIVDEAQEMKTEVLNELRLLCSSQLDSQRLLTVVLGGDARCKWQEKKGPQGTS